MMHCVYLFIVRHYLLVECVKSVSIITSMPVNVINIIRNIISYVKKDM